jgi:hypothetical protein
MPHVGGHGAANHRRVERLIEDEALAHGIDERVSRPLRVLVHHRPGHAVFRIHRVELGRRDQRKVRRNESDVKRPWLVARRAATALEPLHRFHRDLAVVARVLGLARARFRAELCGAGAARQLVADQSEEVAHAVHDMQRKDLFGEAVSRRIGIDVVQLADRRHAVALRDQAVTP